jgi:hypothetical protein
MAVLIATLILLGFGLYFAVKLSPFTERMMSRIWCEERSRKQAMVIRRIKELCVDGHVPEETAKMMIAKEHNIMEEQVLELMRGVQHNPAILRMAIGGKSGSFIYNIIKKLGAMGG